MGQKVNPNGLRVGIIRDWQSRWIASTNAVSKKWIMDDDNVRKMLFVKFRKAFIDRVEIERSATRYDLFIYASMPYAITGSDAVAGLADLTKAVNKIVGRTIKVSINVVAVEKPELSATIIAREIADAIENRVSFRNAQKTAIRKVMRAGAKGIKTNVSGRLGGVEIAREEGYNEGNTPLSTLRADIDYALAEAATPQGQIGCKVWINRGEIFSKKTISPKTKSE